MLIRFVFLDCILESYRLGWGGINNECKANHLHLCRRWIHFIAITSVTFDLWSSYYHYAKWWLFRSYQHSPVPYKKDQVPQEFVAEIFKVVEKQEYLLGLRGILWLIVQVQRKVQPSAMLPTATWFWKISNCWRANKEQRWKGSSGHCQDDKSDKETLTAASETVWYSN